MPGQTKKILLVEDEKILAQMYKDKFEEAGFETDVMFSAEEAFEYLKKERPDLIILDILLPRKNGVGFLEMIKEIPSLREVPIIGLSNYDDPETKKRAFDLGIRDYLIKTEYTPQELLSKISRYLD
jgi:DNA-binding response OmpR family regulator